MENYFRSIPINAMNKTAKKKFIHKEIQLHHFRYIKRFVICVSRKIGRTVGST